MCRSRLTSSFLLAFFIGAGWTQDIIDKDVEIISGKEMPLQPKQFGARGNSQFHEAYEPLVINTIKNQRTKKCIVYLLRLLFQLLFFYENQSD